MLSFLSPLYLIGAVAAAVPIVLHLLKREPEVRVRFAAVKLLKRAPVEDTKTRRIRELVLLAMRVAALVLLAAAFARPFVASGAALGVRHATIIALDTSYSMSAPGTFAKAKRLAKAAVAAASRGDLVGVVTFDDNARVEMKASDDRVVALSAIDAATPGFGATRYRAGVGAAVEALGGRPGTIVIVTDLQESGWDGEKNVSIPEADRVEIVDVGSPPLNFAVTAVRAAGDRITATIHNDDDRVRETRAHLDLDGRGAGDQRVVVGPRTSVDVEFRGAAQAEAAAVSVDDATGIRADNVRYLVLGAQPSILVVTRSGALDREALYLQQALVVDVPDRPSYRVQGASPAEISSWDARRVSTHLAVVLLSTRGLERRGREALAAAARGGVGLLIAAGPDVDGEVISDVLGRETPLQIASDPKPVERTLAPVDVRHPIFQPFGAQASPLRLVTFHRISRIGGANCQVLARFSSGETALVECAAGDGRVLVFASDLGNGWNDFPLHAAFVPFLHEAIRYLAGIRPRFGEYLVGAVPPGVPPVPGVASISDTPGPVRMARRVAVNLDPRESDATRISLAEFQRAITRLKDAGVSEARAERGRTEDRQQLWRYVLLSMIVVLAVEGIVAARTA